MVRNKIRVILDWVIDNLFDLITIVVAAVIVIWYQIHAPTQEDIPELMSWVLGVLGLIAVSGLWERSRRLRRIEHLTQENHRLALRYLEHKALAKDFFHSEPRLTSVPLLASANTIYLAGKVLTRTVSESLHTLERRLKAGATVRVIILDPDKEEVLRQLSLRSVDAPPEFWLHGIRATEQMVQLLGERAKGMGKIEIGYLPYVPSFALILIDPDQPQGIGFVEIYPHKHIGPHPTFKVLSSDDPLWFDFFKEQFEKMWQSCRIESFA